MSSCGLRPRKTVKNQRRGQAEIFRPLALIGITDGMPSWGKSLYVIFIILFREKKEKKEKERATQRAVPGETYKPCCKNSLQNALSSSKLFFIFESKAPAFLAAIDLLRHCGWIYFER
jgi:hypothetical protein